MEDILYISYFVSIIATGVAGEQRTCGFFGGALYGLLPIVGQICILAYPHRREAAFWHFMKSGKDVEQK